MREAVNVDTTKTVKTGISFCTGMRGLEIGLQRAGVSIRELCYVEIETFIIANLVAAMEKGALAPAPIWSNLKTFRPHPFRGMVDFVTAGYPCQPFSLAGLRSGEKDPRHLWPYIDYAIDIIRPGVCFFENVAAHLTLGYETVRGRLQDMGYHVEEGIYAAEEVGAPHRRERLFILAIRKDYDASEIMGDTKSDNQWRKSKPAMHREGKSIGGSGSSNVANTNEQYRRKQQQFSGGKGTWTRDQSDRSGVVQDDTFCKRLQRHAGNEHGEGWEQSGPTGSTTEASVSSSELAHSYNNGESLESGIVSGKGEKIKIEEQWERWHKIQRERCGTELEFGCINKWPARPGEEQQAWESPRVLSRQAESSMGIAIDGYNFREDLLRMAGNGVVPQQAEYAFRDLIRKHGY